MAVFDDAEVVVQPPEDGQSYYYFKYVDYCC